jgi:hypothetical protein
VDNDWRLLEKSSDKQIWSAAGLARGILLSNVEDSHRHQERLSKLFTQGGFGGENRIPKEQRQPLLAASSSERAIL